MGDGIGHAAVPVLQEREPSASVGKFLVVKVVDILEVTVQSEEEFCLFGEL